MDITIDQLSNDDTAFQEAKKKKGVALPAGEYECRVTGSRLKRFGDTDVLFLDVIVLLGERAGEEFSYSYNLTRKSTMFLFVNAYHLIDAESTKDRLKDAVALFMQEVVGRDCQISVEESADVDPQGNPYINYYLKQVYPRVGVSVATENPF